ncbi:unnamed protein product [Rotaria sp. Silwood2]|nr:unnamed protein product [Rotaria sp. Silwood2]CAF4627902.1 unnamed protein product [Rotaria sp. Silwood2]
MDEQFDFRALLLKLQDYLSDNDRRRLHFIVGDTIPRHLRDDPTLGGTLSLLECLFDQAKISEQDFDYLICAFNEIHCYEGVKRLQEYQRRQQGHTRNESNVSKTRDYNEENTINETQDFSTFTSIDISEQRESTLTQSIPISFNKEDSNLDSVQISMNAIKSEKKMKRDCTMKQIDADSKEGMLCGERLAGDEFDDAVTNLLTLNDKLIGITATWSFDTLNSIIFIYSNGKKSQHGIGDAVRISLYSSEFNLMTEESFTGVTNYLRRLT